MRRASRAAIIICGLTAIAGVMAFAPATAIADPAGAPFATITGTVAAASDNQFAAPAPLAAAHADVIVRLVVSGAGATEVGFGDGQGDSVGGLMDAGEIEWAPWTGSFAAGDTVGLSVTNNGSTGAAFEADFYDVPSAPVSYNGASFLGAQSYVHGSDLEFNVLGAQPYIATVTISSGAISITAPDNNNTQTTMSSSGQVALGNLAAGVHDVLITPLSGPMSQWRVAITPVPLTISGVGFSAQDVPAGTALTLSYSLDAQATITANITNAAGTVVRGLAAQFQVPYSTNVNSLTWDGRDASGKPVPDGTYTATIAATDAAGNTVNGTATVVVDSTPPTAALTTQTLKPDQAATVDVADATSGVASASATFDNGVTRKLQGDQSVIAYAPPGGWKTGRHAIVVNAADRAGNKLHKTLWFAVVARKETPAPASPSSPKLLGSRRYANQTPTLLVKPSEIVYTGDGSGVLGGFSRTGRPGDFGRLAWSSWTSTRATASGAVWLDNCSPDCAAGTFFPFAVTIVAFDPSHGYFTRLTLRFRYKGKSYVDKRAIVKQGANYRYDFAPGFLPG